MTTNTGRLPIGVVIPTLNSATILPKHVAALRDWIDLVEEIVVVDSYSEDGTLAYLQEHLQHPNIRFLSHPRGLYQSWNYGIAQLRSEFTYIATAGDSITADGLTHLCNVARETDADVVVSPPEFVTTAGRAIKSKRSTIYDFMRRAGRAAPCRITSFEAFMWSVVRSPGSILESSASNLYRTTVLQERPFPTEYSSGGDVAWALLHAPQTRMTVTPRTCAQFVREQRANTKSRAAYIEMRQKLYDLAKSEFANYRTNPATAAQAAVFSPIAERFWNTLYQTWEAREHYAEQRQANRSSINPAVWLSRFRRRQAKRKLSAAEEEIGQQLATAFTHRA